MPRAARRMNLPLPPMRELLQKHKQYLLTGVSYVIPFIACGGILIALALTYCFQFHILKANGTPDLDKAPAFVQGMAAIGGTAFQLFPAILAGFISYGMASKPGLVAGFVGGFIAGQPQTVDGKTASAGFLGAIIIGLIAGHVVYFIKKWKVPALVRPVMPIIIIPIFSALPVGLLMRTLDLPIATIMVHLGQFLEGLQRGSQIVL